MLTGATGYIGGRLLPRLLERGLTVHALVRNPDHLRHTAPLLHVFKGDLLDIASLSAAMRGVHTAYYMVHSMGTPGTFEQLDREAARNFSSAAAAAGIKQIIYLGGLATGPAEDLSVHMASRHEVGQILRSSGIPVVELRASIVVGSGSLSFELIRALVERLPVMVTPRWVAIRAQPIGIEDLIAYLLAALNRAQEDAIYEIGGADQVSYAGLMQEYARQRGLRRRMIPVPVLTPRLSSLWLGLVTPIYARVGRALISSIRNQSVVQDTKALQTFEIRPQGVPDMIAAALRNEDQAFAETRWSDALSSAGNRAPWGGAHFGPRIVDSRVIQVPAAPAYAFAPIQQIGGANGWYYANGLWKLRGWIDLWVGGVGLRRGRRDPKILHPGDTLDWWRVEAIEPDRLLRLRAEMKLPGRAWLVFEVKPDTDGSEIRQTALFDPVGIWGLLYWYSLYPLHRCIFAGMLRAIAQRAIQQ